MICQTKVLSILSNSRYAHSFRLSLWTEFAFLLGCRKFEASAVFLLIRKKRIELHEFLFYNEGDHFFNKCELQRNIHITQLERWNGTSGASAICLSGFVNVVKFTPSKIILFIILKEMFQPHQYNLKCIICSKYKSNTRKGFLKPYLHMLHRFF